MRLKADAISHGRKGAPTILRQRSETKANQLWIGTGRGEEIQRLEPTIPVKEWNLVEVGTKA